MREQSSTIEHIPTTIENPRDADLRILAGLRSLTEAIPGTFFLVTGSYAVDSLTNTKLTHDDLDANIFTNNTAEKLAQVAQSIEETGLVGRTFSIYKRTHDRLEYDSITPAYEGAPKRLEIQFVDYKDHVVTPQGIDFTTEDKNGRISHVQTTLNHTQETNGSPVTIRTKSLTYMIATWAIRIGGFAENQKRQVRPSDIEHLNMLLKSGYSKDEVIAAINRHVQVPHQADAAKILQAALTICNS